MGLGETMNTRAEFEKLLWPIVDALYRAARSFVDAAAAEDLVQDAALRGWQAFDQFQTGSNFRAWMFRILRNAGINAYRQRARRGTPSAIEEELTAEAEKPPEFFRGGDARRLAEALGDEASEALFALPLEFREVFVLSTFEELSYREISETLGIPIGTVMSRLFRARQLMRSSLLKQMRSVGPTP